MHWSIENSSPPPPGDRRGILTFQSRVLKSLPKNVAQLSNYPAAHAGQKIFKLYQAVLSINAQRVQFILAY